MSTHVYNGAIVLIALLPILPLAMYLRRKYNGGIARSRSWRMASLASLSLLFVGTGLAFLHGVF